MSPCIALHFPTAVHHQTNRHVLITIIHKSRLIRMAVVYNFMSIINLFQGKCHAEWVTGVYKTKGLRHFEGYVRRHEIYRSAKWSIQWVSRKWCEGLKLSSRKKTSAVGLRTLRLALIKRIGLEFAENLPIVDGDQSLVGAVHFWGGTVQVDVFADETHGSVCEQELGPAGVLAAEAADTVGFCAVNRVLAATGNVHKTVVAAGFGVIHRAEYNTGF